ncbi:PAS domain S-box protein [Methanoregula sp.]|uniref:PAS domain S-box protein n=1 Tax=Methanoregula sp. TaxID=2052170 RepID=UPI002614EC8C|nr:PAS domain S-box protein [Methanoregula sp.]MDD5144181.1 PAS domain S-box protein [Methanoregula sp.]
METENEQTRIRDLLRDHPKGLTIEDVSKKLSLNRATAAKYLNSMMISGQAELRVLGRAKVFYLSQRLPLTNLLSLSSDLILILDRELFIQEVNDPFLSFFQVTKDELKGKRIDHSALAQYFSGDFFDSLGKTVDGTEFSSEVHFDIDKNDRYFKVKLIPLVFENGSHAAGILLEDITAMKQYQIKLEERIQERTANLETEIGRHKRTENALRENEAVLKSMLNATPVGVGLLIDRVFTKVNNSLCNLTGYTKTELTGQSARILYPDDEEYHRVNEELYNKAGQKNVTMVESRIRKKDGSMIKVIINLSPFDPDNPSSGVTATIVDITERKRAADALRQASNQVALLTSVTRHDILNKITVLKGYIGWMKRQEASDELREIIKKEEEIAETIANLIAFTRDYKEVGVMPPDWIRIEEMVKRVRKTADLGQVTLHPPDTDYSIYADPLIEKVFYNLLDNSLRHGEKVTEIRISTVENEDRLVILYEDNGIGIPENEKETIFERDTGKNTGLGLFLAREILAITGITIAEAGEPGKGARFEMHIPKGSYSRTGTASKKNKKTRKS